MQEYQKGTQCLHAGYVPESGEPRNIPIVQSTTFRYGSSEAMGALFDLEAEGYFYTRLQNPTSDRVAAKICALEGGTAAMLTSWPGGQLLCRVQHLFRRGSRGGLRGHLRGDLQPLCRYHEADGH